MSGRGDEHITRAETGEKLVIDRAARAYVGARIESEGINGAGRAVETAVNVDRAWHELAFVVLGECRYCDTGTCPLEREAVS